MATPFSEGTYAKQPEIPTSAATEKTQAFPFFNRLPSEIRQEIWFRTFNPRILQIMIHFDKSGDCYRFTATEDLVSIRPSYLTTDGFEPSPALSKPYPPGPVALRVCHESRQVALKNYELAFGPSKVNPSEDSGSPEATIESGKKIWVDFRRDLIAVLSHENKSPAYSSGIPNHPVYHLTVYAKEETAKIQRLAVSECWYPASHPVRLDRHIHQHLFDHLPDPMPYNPTAGPGYFDELTGFHRSSAASYLRKFLGEFKNIKELEVYEIGGQPIHVYFSGSPSVESDILEADMAAWRKKLIDVFEIDKENTPTWTADLPSIIVRKGLYGDDNLWDGTFVK